MIIFAFCQVHSVSSGDARWGKVRDSLEEVEQPLGAVEAGGGDS